MTHRCHLLRTYLPTPPPLLEEAFVNIHSQLPPRQKYTCLSTNPNPAQQYRKADFVITYYPPRSPFNPFTRGPDSYDMQGKSNHLHHNILNKV